MGPIATGPDNGYVGKYKLGKRTYQPRTSANHTNDKSWAVIKAMFELSPVIDYWDLCVACRHHKHGTKAAKTPQEWVNYLERGQYIVRVK